VRNLDHVGRVGAYPEMAAAQGFVCLAYVNAQGRGKSVAPFGGLGRLLGTNPMAAAFPSPRGAPILLDFATSSVAANKIRVAHTRGKPAGEGWIVDDEGQPTRDPQVFIEGKGNMLPLGGEQGHKGFGLAVMVDLLGGVLAGAGCANSQWEELNNGTFFIVINPRAFVSQERYDQQVGDLMDYLHAARRPAGKPPVMLPGEFEQRNREQRTRDGFEVEDAIWESIQKAAAAIGVGAPLPRP
ncbi:MAG TPA: Ldh family oxidoreductase, partial [bacterium]|nr:Ldh family oxidoreductase [bacterium]